MFQLLLQYKGTTTVQLTANASLFTAHASFWLLISWMCFSFDNQ